MKSEAAIVHIAPNRGWRALNLGELWPFRELLAILVWRDLKVRYRQTILGAAWILGQPLLTMLIFTFIFNRLAKIDSGSVVPYEIFVLTGLLPWNFFVAAVQNSGNSLIGNTHLISKVYFPRLLVPTSAILAALVDLAVCCLLLAIMLIWYAIPIVINIVVLPAVIVLACGLSLGMGLWLSALNVEYRDIRVVMPFLLQMWMFATPVVYPLHLLPERYQFLASLNPMTGVVEAFRWCLIGTPLPANALAFSITAMLGLLLSGAFYFRRMERRFVDLL